MGHKFSAWTSKLNISLVSNFAISIIFAASAIFLVQYISNQARAQALIEAQEKAKILLDRNLATHTYFSKQLKPNVFALINDGNPSYFEPSWMSSTYAVREIDTISKQYSEADYYYKECAINARSPQNEADPFERDFIKALNADQDLEYQSTIRKIDGKHYFVSLRRGETMEKGCLRCHSVPENAPLQLVQTYGPKRSFNRQVGEVVSAISIRVPLSNAYAMADSFSNHLSAVFLITLLCLFAAQSLIYRHLVGKPLSLLRDQAGKIIDDDRHLGEELPVPVGRELSQVAIAFNGMSTRLRRHIDQLEDLVAERTAEWEAANASLHEEIAVRLQAEKEKEKTIAELEQALQEIKTLRAILPLCTYCKKIRDDDGYWEQVDIYIQKFLPADISHSICPDCLKKQYPEEYASIMEKRSKKADSSSD